MRITKKSIMTCVAVMFTAGVYAQNPQQNERIELTLDQAINIALDDNPTIKIADLEIERQKYVKRETIGNHLPQLSATSQYSRAIKKSEMASGISFEPDNTWTTGVNLTLPLFAPGVYQTLKLNEQQRREAVEAARSSKLTLVNAVKNAYYGILQAELSLATLRTSEQNTQETVDDIRVKYQNGLASEYDYISANVQLSNLRPTILAQENAIDILHKQLKMLLDIPDEVEVATIGTLEEFAENVDESSLTYNADIEGNSDLRTLDIQLEILRRQLKVSRTQRMPSLAAFAGYTLSGRDEISFPGIGGTTGGGGGGWEWQHPISAGVTLSIPIFSGMTNVNRERQTKNTIQQMNLQRNYTEENLLTQAKNAYNSVLTAEASMVANKETIDQAQKAYVISQARYDAGMGTILELNSAELQLTQSRLNYSNATFDYLSAIAEYELIIGKEE